MQSERGMAHVSHKRTYCPGHSGFWRSTDSLIRATHRYTHALERSHSCQSCWIKAWVRSQYSPTIAIRKSARDSMSVQSNDPSHRGQPGLSDDFSGEELLRRAVTITGDRKQILVYHTLLAPMGVLAGGGSCWESISTGENRGRGVGRSTAKREKGLSVRRVHGRIPHAGAGWRRV